MKRFARMTILATALVWAAAGAVAAADTVRDIVFRRLGGGPMDEGFLTSRVGTRVGAPLDRQGIARDVRALMGTGRFAYVDVAVEPAGEGVRVVYSVQGRLRLVEPVAIEGVTGFRPAAIRDRLKLEPGDLVDDQVVGGRVRDVLDFYRKKRYPDATATWEIVETDREQGLARVVVRFEENARATVARLDFDGNTVIPDGDLRRAAGTRAWYNPLRWFTRRRYDPGEYEVAQLAIRDLYTDRGYLDVKVGEAVTERTARGRLAVRMAIEEGALYRVDAFQFEGVTLFPENELRRVLTLKPGDLASAKRIQACADAVRDFYEGRGYIDTLVRTGLQPDPAAGRVAIRLQVREGRLVSLRNVVIRGNTRTRDKVIRRELLVYPGEVYNGPKVRTSEKRAMNLGYFSSVRSYDLETPRDSERDLVFDVEEKMTGQFMVGVGFSSVDKAMGFIELSQGNFDLFGWPYFTGGGQKLKISAQIGSKRKDYQLSFTEPWFLNRRLSLGWDIYSSDVEYDDYDLRRIGSAVSLTRPFWGGTRLSLQYRLEKVTLSDVADTNRYVFADDPSEEYYFTREEDNLSSSFKLTLSRDTRDNPFVPTRGQSLSLFALAAGGPAGGDLDYLSTGWRSSHYLNPWWRHVLSLRLRYEVIEPYGDTDELPISERLFAGGGRTIRGFKYRDVGPKVVRYDDTGAVIQHRPVGGQSLAVANLEYTIPVVPMVRLAAFGDLGNVWSDPYTLTLDDLALGVGVGVRLDIPGFPIRIDRGWALDKDDELTDEDITTFWIGYDF